MMQRWRRYSVLLVVAGLIGAGAAQAQDRGVVGLTLDETVSMAMSNSFRVKQLQMGIEETRAWLRAERASLKSQVSMELTTPEFESVSDYKWNSELRRDEIIHENTRLWQSNFSIRQPVILMGWPTDGYLSFNNRMYRYAQLTDERDIAYYTRYFFRYEQPLFQPNRLRNAIREAELDLESSELAYEEDVVAMLDDVIDDYYDLFELTYDQIYYAEMAGNLERAAAAAEAFVREDSSRVMELSQFQVELSNAREQTKQAQSNFRLQSSRMKRRLGLSPMDSVFIEPNVDLKPVQIDVAEAVGYGKTLKPRLQRLEIRRRLDQIALANMKGSGAFRANLNLTYGRESQHPELRQILQEPTNSWSVGMTAYVPIWDWGRRSARVQAERIGLQRTELAIVEARQEIESEIANAVQNVNEFQQRALTMQANLAVARRLSEDSLERYRTGAASVFELLQSFSRQRETANNFLEAYIGYRQALFSLTRQTFYDYEAGMPLFERLKAVGNPLAP